MSFISVHKLAKRYNDVTVFENLSFEVAAGEFVAVVGESGVGKSTLLNCLGGLDDWTAGSISIGGAQLDSMDSDARALWRRAAVGFVFQAFHVLPHLDVAQNVALPLMLLGQHDAVRVHATLQAVGLGDLGARLPQQLSGGNLQRGVIARASINGPQLSLAEETTGNLDPSTAAKAPPIASRRPTS